MQIKLKDHNKKEFVMQIDEEEQGFLVEYAIIDLLRKGVISLDEAEDNYLANCDVNTLAKA